MRVQIAPHADLRAVPQILSWGGRRIDIIEIIDQWFGSGYRYIKVREHDRSVYILRFDEICDSWEIIMFSSERAPRLSTGVA
jgi:phosphoenolpyruvate carboxylase